jgi:hypothetical protein
MTTTLDSFGSTSLDAFYQSPLDARGQGIIYFVPAYKLASIRAATPDATEYYPFGTGWNLVCTDGGTRDVVKVIIQPEGAPIKAPASGGRWVTFDLKYMGPNFIVGTHWFSYASKSIEYTVEAALITSSFNIATVTWNTSRTTTSWYTMASGKGASMKLTDINLRLRGEERGHVTFYQDTYDIYGIELGVSGSATASESKDYFQGVYNINNAIGSLLANCPDGFTCYEGF